MKKTIIFIFVAMIVSTNIYSQLTQYQIANIPTEQKGLALDSMNVNLRKTYNSTKTPYFPEILPTTYISNGSDSLLNFSKVSISPFISTDQSVGSINYTSGVSENGAAYINIPLELPKSPLGFTPELAFVYSSMAGRSDLGYGWLFSGISKISRTSRNPYFDFDSYGINSTYNDAFTLDGSRLIQTAVTTTEVNYISESGNVKVTGYRKTIDSKATISHFKVMYPNGLVAIYGFANETRVISDYPMTQITDPLGNSTTFTYDIFDVNGNHYRITGIQYGKNKEYSVEVKYRGTGEQGESREHVGGYTYRKNALIEYVHVKHNTTLLRKYTLNYSYSENRLLTSIAMSNGSSSFNSLRFTYGDDKQTTVFKNNGTSQMIYWYNFTDPASIRTVRGKFDYGSQTDGLLVLPNKVPYSEYRYLFYQYITNKYTGDEDIIISSGLNNDISMANPRIKTGEGFVDILCANLDEFEEEEIIKINNYVSGNYDRLEFTVYTANLYYGLVQKYKRTFDFSNLLDGLTKKSVTPKRFYAGDFNGDGRTEILVVTSYNTLGQGKATKVYLFDLESNTKLYEGTPFNFYFLTPGEASANRSQADIINNSDELFVGDFDGDGKSDICLIGTSDTKVFSFNRNNTISTLYSTKDITRATYRDRFMMSGDFNGDGKTDLILAPYYNTSAVGWTIYSSTGLGFSASAISLGGAVNKDRQVYNVQDINRDGLTELTRTDQTLSGNTSFSVYNIFNGKLDGVASVSLAKNSVTVPVNMQSSIDFNSMIVVPPSGGNITRYSFNYDFQKNYALTSFTNSMGVITTFKYNRLNEKNNENGAFYSRGEGAKFPFYNYDDASFLVATSYKESYNGTTFKDLNYEYYNAVMHRQGLGFQGFEQVTTYDNISYNESEVVTNDPYNWGLTKNRKPLEGASFEELFDYNIIVNANKTRRITLKSNTEKDLLRGFTKTTSFTYDSYDNILTETVDFGSGIKTTKTKKYNYHTGTTLYRINEIYEESDKSEANGLSFTTKKVLTFNSLRQPLTIKTYHNENLVEEIMNTYTSNNLTEMKKKAFSSSNWLSTKYAYDTYGRVTRTTNHLGLYEDNTYNTRGELASVKDHKGLEKRFTYDGWGNKISTTYPDGKVSSLIKQWSSYNLISETVSETGKPTVIQYINPIGQIVTTSEIRFDGKELKTDYQYDNMGRLLKSSIPYTGASASLWNSYTYDNYSRPLTVVYASGKKEIYSYNKNTVTSVIDSVTEAKTYNQLDQIITLTDATGSTNYKYRPDNQLLSVTAVGNVTTAFEYDGYGRKTATSDPSTGRKTLEYDVSGNLIRETDARGKVVAAIYDAYNRLTEKTIDGIKTTYKYNANGLVESITSTDGTSKTISYDPVYYYKPIVDKQTIVDGKWFEKTMTYNSSGVLASISYKSSESPSVAIGAETYTYGYEHLKEIKFAGTTVWRLNSETSSGKPSQVTTGNLIRTYTYDQFGLPTGRTAKNESTVIQDFSYNFNPRTGNLNWRKDNTRNLQENFAYDNMNRLVSFAGKTVKYAANGNILDISSIGSYGYDPAKPYAISQFTPYGTSQVPLRNQTITYNSLMRPVSITENNYVTTFSYSNDGNRLKMLHKKNNADELTRYYFNGSQYEIDKGVAGTKERLYLGGDAYSAAAVYVKEGGSWSLNYICRDYLGSITHVTNASGALRQELSYDAWGRLRNPVNQVVYAANNEPALVLGRGYTGHEHLAMYGLINMNARLYDPVLGRFVSPDPYIQDMYSSQNFNRYSYCLNNPLRYNDENGEIFGTVSGLLRGAYKFVTGLGKWAFGGGSFKRDVLLASYKPIANGVKLDGGWFVGSPWQIISRCTWEFFQTALGYTWSGLRNLTGYVDQVKYYHGATFVIHDNSSSYNGITLGSYINMNIRKEYTKAVYEPSWNGGKFTPAADNMMMHEYGHYLQSQLLGPFYLHAIGIPSMLSRLGWIGPSNADKFYTEKWANDLAYDYFLSSRDHGTTDWDFDKYPISNQSRRPKWIVTRNWGSGRKSATTNSIPQSQTRNISFKF